MSIIVTDVDSTGDYRKSYDITATEDTDTGFVLTHNVNFTDPNPDAPRTANSQMAIIFETLLPAALASRWQASNRTKTQVTFTKENASASGDIVGPQVRVHIERVHSIQD